MAAYIRSAIFQSVPFARRELLEQDPQVVAKILSAALRFTTLYGNGISAQFIEEWRHRLERSFKDLIEFFSSEIAQDPSFLAICAPLDDGQPRLQEIGYGTADALYVTSHMMALALGPDAYYCRPQADFKLIEAKRESTSHPRGVYQCVRLKALQIRLIELLPGQPQDPIVVKLFVVDSPVFNPYKIAAAEESTILLYDALSYVWASDEEDVTIVVNDTPFRITANLNHALHCLRLTYARRILWVDAICINQEDEAEKSEQVNLMGRIYSNAHNVIVFLGPAADESGIVMEYLSVDDSELQENGELFTEPNARFCRANGKALRQDEPRERKYLADYFVHKGLDEDQVAQAAYAFFCRAWWNRMWVVQEVKLAKYDPIWYCGRQYTTMQRMRERLPALHNFTLHKKDHTFSKIHDALSVRNRGRRREYEDLMAWSRGAECLFFTVDPDQCHLKSQNLSTLLDRSTTRFCKDPRDRVFALLGMVEPIGRATLAPDYSLSADHVFRETSAYLWTQEACTRPCELYSFTRVPGLPSWSLDFTKPLPQDATHWLSNYKCPYWVIQPLRAAICRRVLVLTGTLFDEIHVACNLDDGGSNFEVLAMLRTREATIIKYSSLIVRARQDASKFWLHHYLIPSSHNDAKNVAEYICALQDLDEKHKEMLQVLVHHDLEIPGTIAFGCQVLEAVAKIVIEHTRGLDGSNAQLAELLSGSSLPYRGLLRVAMHAMTEEFLNGALFNLLKLESFIESFTPKAAVKRAKWFNLTVPSLYPKLEAVFRTATCQTDLERMKATATQLARLCNRTLMQYMNSGTCSSATEIADAEECIRAAYTAMNALLRGPLEECSADNGRTEFFSVRIQQLQEVSQEACMFQHMANLLAERLKTEAVYAERISVQRQQTSMFVTKAGYLGLSYQRNPAFQKGDKVVLINGFLAPVVLREDTLGRFRIQGATFIVAVDEVDIMALIEEGVLREQRFAII